ncbi:9543_t:CDS:2 [Scutellospora calospora]|uniref:9543_t:CDS:1 n=1 Tax=Scutellospora calospora TaxID=85575 RepID=A0ACA9KGR5_9GLOM|nr:9543_t:CDS:2 [Scutellospora calospora]
MDCKCVECVTSHVMESDYARDIQNLVLRLCRIIFQAIQERKNKLTFQTMDQKIFHGDICSKLSLDQIAQIFKSAKCFTYIDGKYYLPGNTKVTFSYEWNLADSDNNLNHIIAIGKKWYGPFLDYVLKMDRFKRHFLKNDNNELLNNIVSCIPEFKYLYDFHWNNEIYKHQDPCVLLLASDCGVFAIVVIKLWDEYLDDDKDPKIYKEWVKSYKKYAVEKHGNKFVTVIGATYTNKPGVMEPLEFVDEIDYSISRTINSYKPTPEPSDQFFPVTREQVTPFLQPNSKFVLPWASKQTGSHIQPVPIKITKMPLNPGKSPAVTGLDYIYDGGQTESDFEDYYYTHIY